MFACAEHEVCTDKLMGGGGAGLGWGGGASAVPSHPSVSRSVKTRGFGPAGVKVHAGKRGF